MPLEFPANSPLHAFTPAEVEAIFAAGTLASCSPGEVIVNEGEPGDSMFFLIEGGAEARTQSGKTLRSYGPWSYFGELSFINPGHRRSATIVATMPSKLQVLNQSSIQSLIATHPRAIFTLVRRTCAFLVDNERALIADLRKRNDELKATIERLEFTRHQLSLEEQTARTDGLTGLYNRRGFDAELPNFMQRSSAIGKGLALIAMDLDKFKPINDTLGHAAGDFVLKGVAKILLEGVRKTDLPCRIGGDEFIILLADLDETAAKARAEMLRTRIGALSHPGNEQGIQVTSTMGGTLYRPGESAADLMQRADDALYAAKRAGRNRLGWG
jgi:diguanylate cyclase